MNRYFQADPGPTLSELDSPEKALAALQEGKKVWFDYSDPSREDLLRLKEPLGLHHLAIEDCFDDEQIPKTENYDTNTFILFNRFVLDDGHLKIHEVDFFLGPSFLVTVNLRNGTPSGYIERLGNTVEHEPARTHRTPDFLLSVILDAIVDEKFAALEVIQDELDKAEDAVLRDAASFDLASLMELRRSVHVIRKSLFHEREILVKLCRRDSPHISDKSIYHFRDIYDHLSKLFELTESCREIISGLMEMYLSKINNEISIISYRTNLAMQRLTMITTIFMPLGLLAGIGGMSEWSMMTGPENWKISYPLFLLAMVFIGALTYLTLNAVEAKERRKELHDKQLQADQARPRRKRQRRRHAIKLGS